MCWGKGWGNLVNLTLKRFVLEGGGGGSNILSSSQKSLEVRNEDVLDWTYTYFCFAEES